MHRCAWRFGQPVTPQPGRTAAATPGCPTCTGDIPDNAEGSGVGNWKLADAIYRNLRAWGAVPPAQMWRILAELEPVSLSVGNMKPLMVKG